MGISLSFIFIPIHMASLQMTHVDQGPLSTSGAEVMRDLNHPRQPSLHNWQLLDDLNNSCFTAVTF